MDVFRSAPQGANYNTDATNLGLLDQRFTLKSIAPLTGRQVGTSMRRENVLRKIQPSERYQEVVFAFRRATRLCE